jgi:hypothetical protein
VTSPPAILPCIREWLRACCREAGDIGEMPQACQLPPTIEEGG